MRKEEILELKDYLLNHQYEQAMTIVEELEEMGRQERINTLESFLVILLIDLIKIQVEQRITRSWRSSILNNLREIQKRNKLGKKSQYIKLNQWSDHFKATYPDAIFKAADQVFGGVEIKELKSLVNLNTLQSTALQLLEFIYTLDAENLGELISNRFAFNDGI
ncbi:hypothetical protein NIES4102_36720 [Chondrocystis sp. NIES-4102]|nr:hypothetical protein NIES4102_36720 [Chondrocystis sp. NIES-4102]